jgi:hypothetical protein
MHLKGRVIIFNKIVKRIVEEKMPFECKGILQYTDVSDQYKSLWWKLEAVSENFDILYLIIWHAL